MLFIIRKIFCVKLITLLNFFTRLFNMTKIVRLGNIIINLQILLKVMFDHKY